MIRKESTTYREDTIHSAKVATAICMLIVTLTALLYDPHQPTDDYESRQVMVPNER